MYEASCSRKIHLRKVSGKRKYFDLTLNTSKLVQQATTGKCLFYVKKTLEKYFKPKTNVPFERHAFRQMTQKSDETTDQFIVRLRMKADTCDFADANAINEQIREQVIEKCLSNQLRRKLLEKGRTLTLEQLQDTARTFEDSEKSARSMEGIRAEVNKVSIGSRRSYAAGAKPKEGRSTSTGGKYICFAYGHSGHIAKDPQCPAKNQKCRKCHMIGNFQNRCKSKQSKSQKHDKAQKTDIKRVHQVEEVESDYAFIVSQISENYSSDSTINVAVGEVDMPMIIDSGASCNILGREQWEKLKSNNVQCVSSKESKTLYAYGSTTPLEVAGTFKATVAVGNEQVENEEFVVINGKGQSLLGRETALKLNVLRLGPSINVINDQGILEQYPEVTTFYGKLKNFQLKIPLDDTVTPVVLSVRCVPYQLREKLENKLKELEQLDIIEPVSGPCDWVSAVVCVPKSGGKDIRLCVDMRRGNLAVKRERFPIPTIDEILQDLNQSCVYSKLDLRMGYHQIEIHPDSREITTFATHKGLYRYKRLMMGINCAPEMYQKCIQQLLQNVDGAHNILDDISIHGKDKEEHDRRLVKVLQNLKESGLTINKDKCELNMSKLVFMGHVLSARGIGPAEVKVQAVLNTREPETAAEVKSFLGLVTYSSRYLPDFSTVSEPLRRLLKTNEPFVWGEEQQISFDTLKSL